MIDGAVQLFLLFSQNKFYRRLGLVLLIYVILSSFVLFQEILYNDRALGLLGIISHLFSLENGTLIRFSYEVNFWSVIFSQVFLFLIVILSFKWLSKKVLAHLCVIHVDKIADRIEIKIKDRETLRFTVKLSDFKLSVLFILSFDILVQLYFRGVADDEFCCLLQHSRQRVELRFDQLFDLLLVHSVSRWLCLGWEL